MNELQELKKKVEQYRDNAKSGAHSAHRPESEHWEVGQYDAYCTVLDRIEELLDETEIRDID